LEALFLAKLEQLQLCAVEVTVLRFAFKELQKVL